MGMTPQVMGWVLRNQPMLFTCSLCPDAIKKILKTKVCVDFRFISIVQGYRQGGMMVRISSFLLKFKILNS